MSAMKHRIEEALQAYAEHGTVVPEDVAGYLFDTHDRGSTRAELRARAERMEAKHNHPEALELRALAAYIDMLATQRGDGGTVSSRIEPDGSQHVEITAEPGRRVHVSLNGEPLLPASALTLSPELAQALADDLDRLEQLIQQVQRALPGNPDGLGGQLENFRQQYWPAARVLVVALPPARRRLEALLAAVEEEG